MKELYKQFMGKNDIVFDIGANVGNRTIIFAELAGKVIAVEPQQQVMCKLREVTKEYSNIEYVQKGVGENSDPRVMIATVDEKQKAISSFSSEWVTEVRKSGRFDNNDPPVEWQYEDEVTPFTTLDSLINEFGEPAFIKIDVEGYEYQVLSGLSSYKGCLSFEVTPYELLREAVKCLYRLKELKMTQFNISLGETGVMEYIFPVSENEIIQKLIKYDDNSTFGDIYAWR